MSVPERWLSSPGPALAPNRESPIFAVRVESGTGLTPMISPIRSLSGMPGRGGSSGRCWGEGLLTTEAQPNPAHDAIAELDRLRKLDCVITQNVDNLHQKAGVPDDKVFELHGNMQWAVCLGCGRRYPFAQIKTRLDRGEEVPDCEVCHGILKPAVVFFGEPLPQEVLAEATRRSSNCDLFIVVGSTLVVYPAAYMPVYATRAGAGLVIINLSSTPMDQEATVLIRAKAGAAMSGIVERVREKLEPNI